MTKYIEYKITGLSPEQADVLVAELADIGFDSFSQYDDLNESLDCYVAQEQHDEFATRELLADHCYTMEEIEQQNWNALWESNFEPIEVGDRCYIRAPFHEARPDCEHEIVITPKMSFGTGHHPTTHLVVEAMLDCDFATLQGLDMGSGTGVLAILAAQRAALVVDAIDIDEWAYENCIENITTNGVQTVVCPILGDASAINKTYDFILANINRNILLRDMPIYVEALRKGGFIIMSGILEMDIPVISGRANELGLEITQTVTRQGWACVKVAKN